MSCTAGGAMPLRKLKNGCSISQNAGIFGDHRYFDHQELL
jgi:hypothetical protein